MANLGKAFQDALKEGVQKTGEREAKAFAKGLDNLQRNVSGVANLFRGSELVSSLVVRDQLSSTVFSPTVGWQVCGDGSATFRSVTISGGSLLITNTTDRIYLQSDGDAFFGSNIAAPATTSFSIFSNAQTYNSESMGAGDVLFGDNTTSKANLLWDASAGQILVRGGTTTQGYFDTTGRAVFGGGLVVLDSVGMSCVTNAIFSYTAGIRWVSPTAFPGTDNWNYGKAILTATEPSAGTERSWYLCYAKNDDGGETATISRIDIETRDSPLLANAGTNISMYSGWVAPADHHIDLSAGGIVGLRVNDAAVIVNYSGLPNIDLVVKGDTATSLLVCDAGLDAVQIGDTTAGTIADFRPAAIVFNEASNDVDFRVESNGNANAITVDGGLDLVGILRAPVSGDAALTVLGDMQASGYTGWNFANETWTRTAATTFTVPTDLTLKYQKGTKIKLTDTTTKYFYVTASSYGAPNTTVTVTGGSDYSLVAAISSPFYSYVENPQGFPADFAYTPTGISATNVTLSGRFSVIGRRCFVDFLASFTGGITYTTSPTLPIVASASFLNQGSNVIDIVGTAGYLDAGLGWGVNTIFPEVIASATTFGICVAATYASISATSPITWANGDAIVAHFSYEI